MNDMAERIGIYAASRISALLPELIFREQRGGDTGLNAHLEIAETYPKMGKVVGLQIRSDEGGALERAARGYVCRGEMAHVAYWLQHSLPVLVMVYDAQRERIHWESVSPETIEISGQSWELLVPYDQVYGPDSVGVIVDLPCYSPYLARLALDRPWMEIIEGGGGILLEMDEWINRPTAKGSLRLCVLQENGGREAVFEWPFQTDADMPHIFRLPSLFPWALIEVDRAFYREKGAEPPESSGALFPWDVAAGEIARFQLRLSLNDLGRSFLTTECFLRRGEFPEGNVGGEYGEDYRRGIKFQIYDARND